MLVSLDGLKNNLSACIPKPTTLTALSAPVGIVAEIAPAVSPT